jgi:hypothetical protein
LLKGRWNLQGRGQLFASRRTKRGSRTGIPARVRRKGASIHGSNVAFYSDRNDLRHILTWTITMGVKRSEKSIGWSLKRGASYVASMTFWVNGALALGLVGRIEEEIAKDGGAPARTSLEQAFLFGQEMEIGCYARG